MPRTVPIEAVQPSQLYIDVERLQGVLEWFNPADPTYDPLPYLDPIDDLGFATDEVDPERVVLSDGHTRALVAVLCGESELRVTPDPDVETLSLDIYRTCVEWCLDDGVHSPADLFGRVVSHGTFEDRWIARCQALTE